MVYLSIDLLHPTYQNPIPFLVGVSIFFIIASLLAVFIIWRKNKNEQVKSHKKRD